MECVGICKIKHRDARTSWKHLNVGFLGMILRDDISLQNSARVNGTDHLGMQLLEFKLDHSFTSYHLPLGLL